MRQLASALALLLPLLAVGGHAPAAPSATLTLEQVMADPDWIGPAVEQPAWRWDGRAVDYRLKRAGSPVREVYRQTLDAHRPAQRVADAELADLDGSDSVYDRARRRMLFTRNGDVFLRDLDSGQLHPLTRSETRESRPAFAADGGVLWRAGNDWFHRSPDGTLAQVGVVKPGRDPQAASDDTLRAHQLAVLATLRHDREQRTALIEEDAALRRADPTRAAAPVYLGEDVEIVDSALSPDGRHLLVVTQAKGAEAGQPAPVPHYVTESGYVKPQEGRTLVGRNDPLPQALWLVDTAAGSARKLDFHVLPGIDRDPLAALRRTTGKPALAGDRPVRIETDGDGSGPAIHWNAAGDRVAVLIRAVDNKDRWIASVDLDQAKLQPRHRLTDPAWINWSFNDFGWMPNDATLWLLSEQDGHAHLYTLAPDGRARQRTRGDWEVSQPQPTPDGRAFLFLCNRAWPGKYELCRLELDGDRVHELTDLSGVEGYALSPDARQLLVTYSGSYLPTQLAVLPADGGSVTLLTDTRSAAFKAHDWIAPQIVQVPSQHGAGSIWAKYYGPARLEPGKKYPIVMFVHGAGYLQNVHLQYPAYFREQMFHNLLVQRGYIVLDMDYRGSAGHGRDWRTAIYRNMGHPELEDYLDGLDWLVEHKQGNRERAGIYGGSYGGFMTYMALFRAPGTFKAGAALRPVGDWMHYNHEYTSNILNTPELDPEAYKRSSPIEYADGLRDRLLIAHGMIDDNVFFQDSVEMAQKLIELHKDGWELAPYPLERHGFVRPDSWLDEYKRVLKLFEDTLK